MTLDTENKYVKYALIAGGLYVGYKLINFFIGSNTSVAAATNEVKTLTSIIWINMAPLHEYPFNNFLFNFGKYNLYKNLKQ
jgi:hypothetical protein